MALFALRAAARGGRPFDMLRVGSGWAAQMAGMAGFEAVWTDCPGVAADSPIPTVYESPVPSASARADLFCPGHVLGSGTAVAVARDPRPSIVRIGGAAGRADGGGGGDGGAGTLVRSLESAEWCGERGAVALLWSGHRADLLRLLAAGPPLPVLVDGDIPRGCQVAGRLVWSPIEKKITQLALQVRHVDLQSPLVSPAGRPGRVGAAGRGL